MLKTSVFMFPIVAVVSSIPVFSIVIKYNLIENGVSGNVAFLWGVVFPWIVAFPLLYMPNVLSQIVNLSSLVFVSFTDFIVPFALYIVLQRKQQNSKWNLAIKQDTLSEGQAGLLGSPGGDLSESEPKNHTALTVSCGGESPKAKTNMAAVLGVLLTSASVAATILTIVQGSYNLNATTCSLVGS